MPYLRIKGKTTYYAHRRPVPAGQPPVVFVHGAGGTHQHWLYQVRDLSAPTQGDLPRSPTYAPDLPGHGRSEGPGRESIQAYGEWLLAFLDAVELEQAILVGHSMGGAIALAAALHYPQRVAGLGLVATGARLKVAPAILEGILTDHQAAVRLICDWAFGPETPQELVRLGRRQMGQVPANVLYGDFVACDAFDIRPRLDSVSVPTLILCGTCDRMTPVKYSTYLRDHISGAALHLVEGAGHMVMIERPQALLRPLVAFAGTLQG
jgi:pimeloyl-ACP methyl ester carboxylesterase